jgi:hypothetical protein
MQRFIIKNIARVVSQQIILLDQFLFNVLI